MQFQQYQQEDLSLNIAANKYIPNIIHNEDSWSPLRNNI